MTIAHRLREACEQCDFFGRQHQPGGKVTVSIGISYYPEAKNVEELILFADRALYKAKDNRNVVKCYG